MLSISLQGSIFESAPDQVEAAAALYVSVGRLAIDGGALIGGVVAEGPRLPSELLIGGLRHGCILLPILAFDSSGPVR